MYAIVSPTISILFMRLVFFKYNNILQVHLVERTLSRDISDRYMEIMSQYRTGRLQRSGYWEVHEPDEGKSNKSLDIYMYIINTVTPLECAPPTLSTLIEEFVSQPLIIRTP